jgi:hypothetical protein
MPTMSQTARPPETIEFQDSCYIPHFVVEPGPAKFRDNDIVAKSVCSIGKCGKLSRYSDSTYCAGAALATALLPALLAMSSC